MVQVIHIRLQGVLAFSQPDKENPGRIYDQIAGQDNKGRNDKAGALRNNRAMKDKWQDSHMKTEQQAARITHEKFCRPLVEMQKTDHRS